MIPARLAPYLFGLLLSGMMSLLISCLSTLRTMGLAEGVESIWFINWLVSWATAFVVVLVVAPVVRRIVTRLTLPRDGKG